MAMSDGHGDAAANRPQAGPQGAENSEFSALFARLGAVVKGRCRHPRRQCIRSVIASGGPKCLCLAWWDATCPANVAPSGRNVKLLPHPWLRHPPVAATRDYAWSGPTGRTWPIRRHDPSDSGQKVPLRRRSQESERSSSSPPCPKRHSPWSRKSPRSKPWDHAS